MAVTAGQHHGSRRREAADHQVGDAEEHREAGAVAEHARWERAVVREPDEAYAAIEIASENASRTSSVVRGLAPGRSGGAHGWVPQSLASMTVPSLIVVLVAGVGVGDGRGGPEALPEGDGVVLGDGLGDGTG
jgi:hypothetical protein